LSEVLERFGSGSPQRKRIGLRLERIYNLAWATGHLACCVVFGSFVTTKLAPNDVDVFFLMEDTFDITHLTGEARLLFDHAAAQTHVGGSVFWLRRLLERIFCVFPLRHCKRSHHLTACADLIAVSPCRRDVSAPHTYGGAGTMTMAMAKRRL
jgi:uncharacterized protein DUF6932